MRLTTLPSLSANTLALSATGPVGDHATRLKNFLGEAVQELIARKQQPASELSYGDLTYRVAINLFAVSADNHKHRALVDRVGLTSEQSRSHEELLQALAESQDYIQGLLQDRPLLGEVLDTFRTSGRIEVPDDVEALRIPPLKTDTN